MNDHAVVNLMLVFAGLALAFFSLLGIVAYLVLAWLLPRRKQEPSLPKGWRPPFQIREDDDAIRPA